jgi:hypothetical protein
VSFTNQPFAVFFKSIEGDVNDLESKIEFVDNASANISLDPPLITKRDSIIVECNKYLLSNFQDLNNKLLNGDYIQGSIGSNIEDLIKLIREINDAFNSLITTFTEDLGIQGFKADLDKIISALNFLKKLVGNFFYKDNSITYSISTSLSGNFEHIISLNSWCLTSARILCYNIYLINLDHYLKIEREDLIFNLETIYLNSKILSLSKDLTKDYIDITNLIYLKSNFLRKKILLRKAEEVIAIEDGKLNPNKLFIQSTNEYTEFQKDKIIITPSLSKFKEWLEYTVNHYQLVSDFAEQIESKASSFDLSKIDDLPFNDVHLLIKYYKDVLSKSSLDDSITNLEVIKNSLKKRLSKSTKGTFEEFQLIVNTTYCFNNFLSLLEDKQKDDKLLKVHSEFLNIERLKNRKNYFASGILLRYYDRKLKNLFEDDKFTENLNDCKKALSESAILLEKFEVESAWFKNHNNYIYLLSLEESQVQINGFDLYIFSSFVLPTSEKYLENKFKKTVENIALYQTSFKSISTLKSTFNELKSLRKEFDLTSEKLNEKEGRTIEIVTLTTTILVFVSASIQGFKFIKTGTQAIYFTLALGTSLGFFVLLMYVLNRRKLSSYELINGTFFTAIFVAMAWCFLFYFSSKW